MDKTELEKMQKFAIRQEVKKAIITIIHHPDDFYEEIKGVALRFNVSHKAILSYLHILKDKESDEFEIVETFSIWK